MAWLKCFGVTVPSCGCASNAHVNKRELRQNEKEGDYLSCLSLEVHILSAGHLSLLAMQVGGEELQREIGAGRHKSLLEGNQYKQDQKSPA